MSEDDIIVSGKLVATNNYVIIDPSPEHETFGEGLIVTTIVSDNRQWTGKVVSVGPGLTNKRGQLIPCDTKPGTWIAYDLRSIRDIFFEGKWYHVIREEAVFFEYDGELNDGRLRMGKPRVDYEM